MNRAPEVAQNEGCGITTTICRTGRQNVVRRQMMMCEYTNRIHRFSHALLESAPDAIVIVDPDGRITLINSMTEQMFGYERAELLGQPVEVLIPERYREAHRGHQSGYREAPHVRPMGAGVDLFGLRKNGDEFPVEIRLSPVPTGEGTYVYSAIRDVTQRKQLEQALRASEERFELAVRGTQTGIWDWNLQTNVVYFSKHWKQLLGYRQEEIGDDIGQWESRLHPDDREQATTALRDHLQGRSKRYESEHRLRCKDGSYRWFLARGALVRDEAGRPYRIVGSNIDVTSHKRSEEILKRHELQLRAAAEVQRGFQCRSFPSIRNFTIAGRCYPAEFAAGDHFDLFPADNEELLIVLADVSGHGVGPAMLTAAFHAQLRELAMNSANPAEIAQRINSSLLQDTDEGLFATMVLGCLDPDSRTLKYINAGHPPGVVMNSQGRVTTRLRGHNLPVGVRADTRFSASPPIRLDDRDLVLLFTDGLIEAATGAGQGFGEERVVQVARDHCHGHPENIIDALHESLCSFVGSRTFADDVTIVAVKCHADSEHPRTPEAVAESE